MIYSRLVFPISVRDLLILHLKSWLWLTLYLTSIDNSLPFFFFLLSLVLFYQLLLLFFQPLGLLFNSFQFLLMQFFQLLLFIRVIVFIAIFVRMLYPGILNLFFYFRESFSFI